MVSVIDFLHSIAKHLPEVKPPETPPATKDRLIWASIALVLFFIMYHVTALGVHAPEGGIDFLQTVTASRIGSLLTTGIGPIVLASIFLQLFVGAGIIKLNLQDKKDKQKFQEVQKILAIILALVEAIVFTVGPLQYSIDPIFPGEAYECFVNGQLAFVSDLPDTCLQQGGSVSLNAPFTLLLIILQIAFGSIILLYLDAVVSKYGIGSGISLFIAAGVSLAIIGGTINLVMGPAGVIETLTTGGAEALPNALLILLPFFFTLLVFFVTVYAEGVKVEIPIAYQRVRGFMPKLPLKYFYVSNIPVIFAGALLVNIQLFGATALGGLGFDPLVAVDPSGKMIDGLLYLVTNPAPGFMQAGQIFAYWDFIISQSTPIFGIPEWFHAFIYVLFLSLVSVLFGLFWVETANMDAKSVAGQLTGAGMVMPGFRTDPRMLEMILNKHIFPLTVMGSFSVGLLAGVADLTGALGGGTGILLTVGILYRMYEQMEQMKIFDLYPMFGKMVGG